MGHSPSGRSLAKVTALLPYLVRLPAALAADVLPNTVQRVAHDVQPHGGAHRTFGISAPHPFDLLIHNLHSKVSGLAEMALTSVIFSAMQLMLCSAVFNKQHPAALGIGM